MQVTPLTERKSTFVRPLDQVKVSAGGDAAARTLVVLDGAHREYARRPVEGGEAVFTAAGALGAHAAILLDAEGRELERALFSVDCRTEINDGGGTFGELLRTLDYTMNRGGAQQMAPVDGKMYSYFVCWLRDHVHTMKGNKYFHDNLKPGIDLYLDTQCENGMIWDNIYVREPRPNYWDYRFAPEFIRPICDGRFELKRIPVEADVEYLLVEGIYFTWKATGDTEWMKAALPKADSALRYYQTDRYRWSEKYGLVKRGYTIDTWDFQVADYAAIYGHTMVVGPKTPFGIMYGDNTGFLAACNQMAEMYGEVGQADEAEQYRALGRKIKERLDRIAWNGRFYRHRVAEEPEELDLGVDESEQMSLSNSYSLNRGITHEQCVAIIREYMRIREDLPPGSPGEWYAIYPWFKRGFDKLEGEYMNGGVLSIVAGELAHGAFEHGFESYGADILERVLELARRHGDYLHCTFRGFKVEEPERTFTTLDLRAPANVDFHGDTPGRGWTLEYPENDLRGIPVGRQTFCGVPFDVIDPAQNDRRACLALSFRGEPFVEHAVLDLGGRKAGSLYFLHGASNTGGVAGEYVIHYSDGTREGVYLRVGEEITGWWMPHDTGPARLAWWGPNAAFANVGLVAYGWDNPHPDTPMDHIELKAPAQGGILLVAGITLSSAAVYFEPSPISYGIPDNWGAGAVVYALVEGLAGVVDRGAAFAVAAVAPRWTAAGRDSADVSICYPESRGYAAYRYRHGARGKRILLDLTGSGGRFQCHVLLPEGARGAASVTCDGAGVPFENKAVESSRYVDFELQGVGARSVVIEYR